MKKHLFIFSIAVVLVAIGAIATSLLGVNATHRANAQLVPQQILLNWRAETYTPPGFVGKTLPAADSRIVASVDLFDQGKKVDLSTQRIMWYVNDNFYQAAPGLTRINLTAPHFIGKTTIELRVSIPDYGSGPSRAVSIPVVTPEAVIGSSAPGLARSSAPFTLKAIPYFFNIQDPLELQFIWALRGVDIGTENPITITKEMADQANGSASLELRVSNPSRIIERIVQKLILFQSR